MNNSIKYFSLISIFSGNMFAMELQKAAPLRPSKKYDLDIVAPDAARFTRDHKKLVIGSGITQKIYVFDTSDYSKPPFIIDSRYDTSPISLHPNNTEAAVGGCWPVHIWDINTGQNKSILPAGTEGPSSLQYNTEGNLLLVANQKGAKVYDARSNAIVRTLLDNMNVSAAQWNPADNNQIATLKTGDDGNGHIVFWRLNDPMTMENTYGIHPEIPIYGINFSNDGTKIVCPGPDQYVVYETKRKAELLNYYKLNGKKSANNNPVSINMKNENRQALSITFLPDDSGFFAGLSESELVCCKFDKNDESFHFQPDIKGVGGSIWAVAVNSEDNTLAAGIWETTDPHFGTVQIWDIAAIEEKIKCKQVKPIVVNEPRRILPTRPCDIQ